EFGLQIVHMEGGSLRNAIPRESWANIVIPSDKVDAFKASYETLRAEIIEEYETKEPKMVITLEPTDATDAMSAQDSKVFVQTIMAAFNGVYRMSPDVEGLV
ncbi:hypothetical protein QWI17_21625, partial [Gilvimarinus sp. SDUM040013]|nr:hypothetical protein [Gilvimarinus sp. SDUM040013]